MACHRPQAADRPTLLLCRENAWTNRVSACYWNAEREVGVGGEMEMMIEIEIEIERMLLLAWIILPHETGNFQAQFQTKQSTSQSFAPGVESSHYQPISYIFWGSVSLIKLNTFLRLGSATYADYLNSYYACLIEGVHPTGPTLLLLGMHPAEEFFPAVLSPFGYPC